MAPKTLIGLAVAVVAAAPAQADFTSSLAGTTATMAGNANSDTVLIDQAGGLLRHNRFSAGDSGFASDFDWNSSTAGDQTLSATDPATNISIAAGAGDDTLQLGSPTAPIAGIAGNVAFDGQGGSDVFDYDDSADAVARTVHVRANEIFIALAGFFSNTEIARAELGSNGDTILVETMGPGVLTSVTGGGGNDTITFADQSLAAGHSYVIGTSSLQRDSDGVVAFSGIEAATLNAGSAADTIFKSGALAFALNGNAGADTFSTRDAVTDTVNCGADADNVLLSDAAEALTDCEASDRTPAPPSLAGTDPASPANENAPKVKGSAAAGTTVRLFTTADCSGTPAATGTAADFASPGLAVTVADNTTTTLRATATEPSGFTSACSADALTYVESTPAAVVPPDTTKPTITLAKLPKKVTIGMLEKGLTIRVTPSEASKLSVVALGSAKRATAAALQYNLTLASASHKLAAGQQKLRLKVSKALIGKARTVHVKLRITATDAAGNAGTLSRSFTARRR